MDLKKIIRKKATKRILALLIAAALGYLGLSGEIATEFSKVSAELISEGVAE